MMWKVLNLLFLLAASVSSWGQSGEFTSKVHQSLLEKIKSDPQEKLYLHTDRSVYYAGEKIWFRAYLQNAVTHAPSGKSKFIYVELINEKDSVVERIKIASKDSVFSGYIGLSQEFPQGKYYIRGYSYYMQNMGDDFFYKKNIRIIHPAKNKNNKGNESKTKTPDIDIVFFPEGGDLLPGNYQTIGFKAINEKGLSEEVSGFLFNSRGDTILPFATKHDGMGLARLSVQPGESYHAIAKSQTGAEKRVELPKANPTGLGLKVNVTDSTLKYSLIKGSKANLPENLYVVVHTRGFLETITPVNRLFTGIIPVNKLLEGIAHVLLIDDQCRIYSQRICFIRKNNKPQLNITTDKSLYSPREKVELNLYLENPDQRPRQSSFSISVLDENRTPIDSTEGNILSTLLLTSDLKGHIERPGYYFNDPTPQTNADLDLVMLIHGWTRFDITKEIKGEFDTLPYYVEQGQSISGYVENFWGKDIKSAQILLLSTAGHTLMTEADASGHFLIEGIQFPEKTQFIIQANNQKGRKNVNAHLDQEKYLPSTHIFSEAQEIKNDDLQKYLKNYYYENGEKVYLLEEAEIKGQRIHKTYSPYDQKATYRLDSAQISESYGKDLAFLLEQIPGIKMEEDKITRYDRDTLMIVINDFNEGFEQLKWLQPDCILNVSLLDPMEGLAAFGEGGKGGALILTIDPARRSYRPSNPSFEHFMPLGYQRPAEFYAPKYKIDSVRNSASYDERSTIYWNPRITVNSETPGKVSFYTADMGGKYTVIVEGISNFGEIYRKVIKLNLK